MFFTTFFRFNFSLQTKHKGVRNRGIGLKNF